MEKETKLHEKWWFWVCIVLIIACITCICYFTFNKSINVNVNNDSVFDKSHTSKNTSQLTAEDITNKLKEKCSNIGEIVVYTEETDPNELLGRPNGYTSKIVFADTRITQPEKMTLEDLKNDTTGTEAEKQKFLTSHNEPYGGTIEIFSNETDMQKRKDYLSSMMSSGNTFLNSSYAYIYSNACILLRIHRSLTPTQAEEYENAFNEIMNNI